MVPDALSNNNTNNNSKQGGFETVKRFFESARSVEGEGRREGGRWWEEEGKGR